MQMPAKFRLKKRTLRNEIGIFSFDRGWHPLERVMISDREISVDV